MIDIFLQGILPWYLAILLAGWLAFPLAYRLLSFLPDRGYTFARPIGLLVWGFLYWLLTSLHLLQNDLGGVVFALLLVAGLSIVAGGSTGWRELRAWLAQRRGLLITAELLFLLTFVAWSLVRAVGPEASGTEKPMELAFINAILRSDSFPPHDPWLSGYAISYYYFGYVIVAMLARLTGISGAVAFNLGGASWFALTALAAYGLLTNLLSLRRRAAEAASGEGAVPSQGNEPGGLNVIGGLLAPLFLLLVSNLEGFLEVLHARGLFWQPDAAGNLTSAFWKWLDIQELVNPPAQPFGWVPERLGGIWWWRASRVLQDYDLAGSTREIIDEFPFFSFLLADLHPHVLAMPFVLLAVGLALNLYLRTRAAQDEPISLAWLRRYDLWLAALVLGGLSFLNTWDFPIYLALFGAAYGLARYQAQGWHSRLLVEALALCGVVGIAGIGLYLPFYTGFASQAKGLLPSLVYFTRGTHLWIMFGSLLLPVLAWLLFTWRRGYRPAGYRPAWKHGLIFALAVTAGLWLLSFVVGLGLAARGEVLWIYGATSGDSLLLVEALARRLAQPGTWLTLIGLLTITWALLTARPEAETEPEAREISAPADRFVLLLILLGAGLVLFPEFFYLFDQFSNRMNTIFKFYFQAWIVWSLAAAYGLAVLLRELRGGAYLATVLGTAILLVMSLAYPFFGLLERLASADYSQLSLDGAAAIQRYSPDDMAAIDWLSEAPVGVLAEAVGGSYSGYARVSTFSGQPAVLGWPGHESQWRGGEEEKGSREADIELLYRANRWEQMQAILQRYQIRYVYVGSLERGKYRVNRALYNRYLNPVFQNQQVTIYEVPPILLAEEQVKQP